MVNPDPELDGGCYKAGDPVVVMPDGHVWGASEGLPAFWRVTVTGMTVEQGRAYLDAQRDGTALIRRRAHLFDLSTLPPPVRTQLAATGAITVTVAQASAALKQKP